MYHKNQFRQLLNDRAGTVGTRLHSTWHIVTEAVGALENTITLNLQQNMPLIINMIWKILSGPQKFTT